MARHPDFEAEASKTAQAIQRVKEESAVTDELLKRQQQDVEKLRIQSGGAFNAEWFVAEKLYVLTQQKSHNLVHALENPFFARVDFKQQGAQAERYYIGKWGLIDAATQRPYIVDWRSPVANLYYGAQVGPASYASPGGAVSGELLIKRIFTITGGELKQIIDADIVTQDEYMNDILSGHADARLRDIVTTIQNEQNQILRHAPNQPLIVQGVAGAGKTTIALHRITWLLYTYQETMAAENLMVIAPTPLFLNYISSVLPELGAENVLQTTFFGLAELLCGIKLPKLNDSDTLMELLGTPADSPEHQAILDRSHFKGSLLFRQCLDHYIHDLERHLLPNEAFKLGGRTICSREELLRTFCVDLSPFSLTNRIPELRKFLSNRLKSAVALLKETLEAEVEKRANLVRLRLREDTPERRAFMSRLYASRDEQVARMEQLSKGAVAAYLKQIPPLNLLNTYKDFLSSPSSFSLPPEVSMELWEQTSRASLDRLNRNQLETADLAPLIYLAQHTHGHAARLDIHHTVLDEAQDFSTFQFDVLKSLTHNNSFTIVGDLAQGIYSYRGVTDWSAMMEDVFGERADYAQLVTSYRNTVEIMGLATRVDAKFLSASRQIANPVLRHGAPPTICPGGPKEIAAEALRLKQMGLKSVAIIHKFPRDCESLYAELKEDIPNLTLYSDSDDQYTGGIMVIPAHLVKGLEFDAVIMADVSESHFPADELHCRLLYVCLTRPLHYLSLFYSDSLSPLLK